MMQKITFSQKSIILMNMLEIVKDTYMQKVHGLMGFVRTRITSRLNWKNRILEKSFDN
jgi:hypothetical protein